MIAGGLTILRSDRVILTGPLIGLLLTDRWSAIWRRGSGGLSWCCGPIGPSNVEIGLEFIYSALCSLYSSQGKCVSELRSLKRVLPLHRRRQALYLLFKLGNLPIKRIQPPSSRTEDDESYRLLLILLSPGSLWQASSNFTHLSQAPSWEPVQRT
jgi:hypothetical protein